MNLNQFKKGKEMEHAEELSIQWHQTQENIILTHKRMIPSIPVVKVSACELSTSDLT